MTRLLIGGDSWGCGEWEPLVDRSVISVIRHRGLEQYLTDENFHVVNTSQGGSNNIDSVSRLVKKFNEEQFDHVIWFQTDPIRDLRPYTNFNSQFDSYQDLLKQSNQLLNLQYKILNQLGSSVICIGGCSKLDPDICNYENLIPLVDSMIELLVPHVTAPKVWHSDWVHAIKSIINENLLDQLLVNKRTQDQLRKEAIFRPDGMHPNRQGHRVLFNIVKEFLIKGES